MSALQIAMAAGETSGDLLAGAVIRQLSMRLPPDSRYFGIGGAQMRAAGFQARFPSEKLAVRGYVEAARHLPESLWLRRAFKRTLLAAPPSVFVGVDAPDFQARNWPCAVMSKPRAICLKSCGSAALLNALYAPRRLRFSSASTRPISISAWNALYAAPAFQRCISSVRRSGRGAARAFIKSNAQRI